MAEFDEEIIEQLNALNLREENKFVENGIMGGKNIFPDFCIDIKNSKNHKFEILSLEKYYYV